jgi:hypothetical protein
MMDQVKVSGVHLSGVTTKKILFSALLLIALLSMAASYFLGQEQITRAADLQQKVKFVKANAELMNALRTSLEAPGEPVPAYFQSINKNYKLLDKALGADKMDPNLEKLLTDKLKSDQHLRARMLALRDGLKPFVGLEKTMTVISAGFDSFLTISSTNGLLDVGRIRTDSPFRKTTELLNSIAKAGPVWLASSGDAQSLNALQASFTQLGEQRALLDGLATSNQLAPRQLEIYKSLKKIPLWAKSNEYLETLNQFNGSRNKLIELTRDREGATALVSSMESELNNNDSDLLMNALKLLTIVCIVGALILNLVIDRKMSFGAIGGVSSSDQVAALRETQDILPYTQIAIGQITELGGKVLNAIKRFHTAINDENFAERRKQIEAMAPNQVAQRELSQLKAEIVALREQALQLTLSNTGTQSPISLPESAMRLNKVVENLEVSLAALQKSIVEQFAKKQNIETKDLQGISRESEGLIVALTQLDRQIVRMEGVLEEMDQALRGAIQGSARLTKSEPS